MYTRRLSFYWAQGTENAPELVRKCWDLWARMNPNWDIHISNQTDAEKACADLGIHKPITFQGLGDIFRVHDIVTHGGVYIDAAVVPLRPLDDWLPELCAQGFFAFHDPYRKRPIENWFLHAEPGNDIATTWLKDIVRYWSIPRRPQRLKEELNKGQKAALIAYLTGLRGGVSQKAPKVIEPKNRRWSVAPKGGAKRPVHPYFWPHYLFDHMLATNPTIRHAWAQVPKVPSYKDQMLRHSQRHYAGMSKTELDTLIHGAHMQKLLLDVQPPAELMGHLFAHSERVIAAHAHIRQR